MVGCDGGDQPGDLERSAIIFRHIRNLKPENNCGAAHGGTATAWHCDGEHACKFARVFAWGRAKLSVLEPVTLMAW